MPQPSTQAPQTAKQPGRPRRMRVSTRVAQLFQQQAAPDLWNVREQLLTVVIRVGALFGSLIFAIAAGPLIQAGRFWMLVPDILVLAVFCWLAFARGVSYPRRGAALLSGVYALGLNELLHFGYSASALLLLAAFAILALLFFTPRVGLASLLLGLVSLAVVGGLIASGSFGALAFVPRALSFSSVMVTWLLFGLVVGTLQATIALLFQHIQDAWQNEYTVRSRFEQGITERTAEAKEQVELARRTEADQKEFLAALHQSTLQLFNHQGINSLLQTIVDQAAHILDAPFGELLLLEGEDLVVRAFTSNQSFLAGDHAKRGEALLSWQAFDTRQPVIIDDYGAWQAQRDIYQEIELHATADFPIIAGDACLGVLAMGRNRADQPFTPADVQHGESFANLIALAIDNANLHAIALREIAERKQAEQELHRYATELQSHNAELDAFAHTVAHDLKNPLTSLLGYTEILQTSQDFISPEEALGYLNDIARVGEKMTLIINGLLLLAGTRAHSAVAMQRLNMGAIVHELQIRFAQTIASSHATIVTPATWPVARGYAPWVEEVWANYLSNAIKYSGSPPEITLGADPAREDGFVRFWMHDNGQGLSNSEQAKLFTPFTHLHTHRQEGHGLGLAIVQQTVCKLGGSVGVESAPGQGCTFYFTLPAV